MVWTVLKQSLMGTTLPINVAACMFQKEIPSFNEMLFLVSPTTSIAIINGQATLHINYSPTLYATNILNKEKG